MDCCACPERDSPRDQLVVTLFLLTVFGLLLGAGIKGKMMKAGIDTSIPWNTGRQWWEVRTFTACLPQRADDTCLDTHQAWVPSRRDIVNLGERGFGGSRDNDARRGNYNPVTES